MKKNFLVALLASGFLSAYCQTVTVTGGLNLTKGTIDADVLNQVIQQKQEEVFTRLFANIVVRYFRDKNPSEGVYNFPTYYSLYNLVSDLTVGKSKTTVSKAVMNSAAELAYIYAFVKYYQNLQEEAAPPGLVGVESNLIQNVQLIDGVSNGSRVTPLVDKLETLNFYMEAAYDVLAKSGDVQKSFYFKRPITSTEISKWYSSMGLINDSNFNNKEFNGSYQRFFGL